MRLGSVLATVLLAVLTSASGFSPTMATPGAPSPPTVFSVSTAPPNPPNGTPSDGPLGGMPILNWNWSSGADVVAAPSNPADLLLLTTSVLWNATVAPGSSGAAAIARSSDGGRSWLPTVLPSAANWSDNASADCTLRFTGDGSLAFAPNGTAVFAGVAVPAAGLLGCYSVGPESEVYLSYLPAGSLNWSVPAPFAGDNSFGDAFAPCVSVNPRDGAVVVVYDAGTAAGAQFTFENLSAPSQTQTLDGSLPAVFRIIWGTGPSPQLTILGTSAYTDFSWFSSDGGASFPAAQTIDLYAPPMTVPWSLAGSSIIGTFGGNATGIIGGSAENYNTSGNQGALYWWTDTGLPPHDMMSTYHYPILPPGDVLFDPSVAVIGNGTIAFLWLDENVSSGTVRPEESFVDLPNASYISGVASWGLSAGGPLNVSWNGTTVRTLTLGNSTSLVPTGAAVSAWWTDLGSREVLSCPGCGNGPSRELSLATATVAPVRLTGNVPSVTVRTSGVEGAASSVAVTPSYPVVYGGREGTPFQLDAPLEVKVGTSPEYFASWFGSTDTANPDLNGTWGASGGDWTACYVTVPGTLCRSPGAPGVLIVHTNSPAFSVAVGGSTWSGQNGTLTALIAPGSWNVTVAAAGYVPVDTSLSFSTAAVVYLNLSLTPDGRLSGEVVPSTSSVAVDGVAIVSNSYGGYTVNVTPGVHDVTFGGDLWHPAVVVSNVTVPNGGTAWLNETLPGQGEIRGTVDPVQAVLKWASSLVAHRTGASYSAIIPANTSGTLTATAPGYVAEGYVTAGIPAGTTEWANLSLVPIDGTVMWNVTPSTASVRILGGTTGVVAGGGLAAVSSIELPPGNYTLAASAAGYTTRSEAFSVVPDAPSWVNLTLGKSPSVPLTGPALGYSTLAKGLALDAALLGGLGALFLIVRRRPLNPSGAGTAR